MELVTTRTPTPVCGIGTGPARQTVAARLSASTHARTLTRTRAVYSRVSLPIRTFTWLGAILTGQLPIECSGVAIQVAQAMAYIISW